MEGERYVWVSDVSRGALTARYYHYNLRCRGHILPNAFTVTENQAKEKGMRRCPFCDWSAFDAPEPVSNPEQEPPKEALTNREPEQLTIDPVKELPSDWLILTPEQKRRWQVIAAAVLLIALLFGGLSGYRASENRNTADTSAAYDSGYADGEAAGYDDGYDDGLSISYSEGYSKGYSKGESSGYFQGYEAGKAYASAKEEATANTEEPADSTEEEPASTNESNATGGATDSNTGSDSGTNSNTTGTGSSGTGSNKATAPIVDTGGGGTVYITNYGTKYHSSGCQFLKKSKKEVSLEWAKSHNYTACKVCGG